MQYRALTQLLLPGRSSGGPERAERTAVVAERADSQYERGKRAVGRSIVGADCVADGQLTVASERARKISFQMSRMSRLEGVGRAGIKVEVDRRFASKSEVFNLSLCPCRARAFPMVRQRIQSILASCRWSALNALDCFGGSNNAMGPQWVRLVAAAEEAAAVVIAARRPQSLLPSSDLGQPASIQAEHSDRT